MDQQKTFDLVRTRAADIRMIVMTFTISHAALMIVLGLAVPVYRTQESSFRLLRSSCSLGLVPCVHGRRHARHDGGAQRSRRIRDERDGAATGEAADRDFRVVNLVFVALIVAAELMAIY